jgi:hypothetical protein
MSVDYQSAMFGSMARRTRCFFIDEPPPVRGWQAMLWLGV